jgi:hypothetical protein
MRRNNPGWDADSQYGPQYIAPEVVGTRAPDLGRGDLVLRACGSAGVDKWSDGYTRRDAIDLAR